MHGGKRLGAIGLAAAILLAGCGGPKTEAHRVTAALQSHLNKPMACQSTTETVILPWEVRDTAQDPTALRLRAMAKVDLVKTRPTTIAYAKAQVPATAYEPASALITVREGSVPIFSNVRFCYARKQVTGLNDAVADDAQQAVVRFNYVYADAPDWTQDAAMQAAFPDIGRNLAASGGSGTATLTRTDGKWTVVAVS